MENTSVKHRILEAAKPYLENLTVQDLVVGISLIAVQLSNGAVGVSYVLRYGLPPECAAFGYARNAIGMSAWDVARWSVEGKDNVGRSIGGAVLSAASQQLDIADDTDELCRYGMEITAEDTVGMIGFIKPVAKTLSSQVKKLYVFDEGVSLYEGTVHVCGMDQQPVLLPQCTKMIITGSSTINGSIDGLLEMCANARQIAIVGSSTPMFPEGWKGTNVTSLAGSWWPKERKEDIFRIISQGGGIAQLRPIIRHKIAFVK
ncbi:MAG: hypothetical protein IJO21_07260 [Oscillospiraceae bacterium]|nr:hypothetical protein [Oscillospiraceae bacterium]MBQ7130819.1 hypothetical protein [Oscillospiraceae bacterium]